jgi:hypothetical protein
VHSSSIQVNRSASPKAAKPLVRTTSTPFHNFNYLSKPNESYSMTSQMSSIHHTTTTENESCSHNTSAQSPTPKELYKMKAALRSRSKVAATPLRQVMSKSIQRAIAQHTGFYTKGINPTCQRKMSFDSTTSSGHNSVSEDSSINVPSPLDLRTSPALKRSASESSAFRFRKPKPVSRNSSASDSSEKSSQISVVTNYER